MPLHNQLSIGLKLIKPEKQSGFEEALILKLCMVFTQQTADMEDHSICLG